MNPKTRRLLIYLAVFNYCYWNLLYPFLKLFRFEKTFNELFWFKSFENLTHNKTGFGISSSTSLKNKDKFNLKGDPLYNVLKVKYLFPLNKAKTILPWTDKNNKFIDFYYKSADQRWSTVKDRTRRGNKRWIKTWDSWDYWHPKVRARKNKIFKKYPKPKKRKTSIYNLATRNLTRSDRYRSKLMQLNKKAPKPKPLAKTFKKLKKRRNKYKWSGNLDYLTRKNGVQMQLEHLARSRRLTERVMDRDFIYEFFPTDNEHPILVNKSLSDYPYKEDFKEFAASLPNMGLTTWDRWATDESEYDMANEKKVTNPLTKRQAKRYKKFLKKRKWYITLNEHIKRYALAKTAERKKKMLEKWMKKKKDTLRWKKVVKKWGKSNHNELLYPLSYKNVQKRASFFEKYLKKIVYCKTEKKRGNLLYRMRKKRFKNFPIQFDLEQVDEILDELHYLKKKRRKHTVRSAWKIFDKMYDILDGEIEELVSVKQDKIDEQEFQVNKFRALLKAVGQNYYGDKYTINNFTWKIERALDDYYEEWDEWDSNNDDDDWLLDFMKTRYENVAENFEQLVDEDDYNDLLIGRDSSEVSHEEWGFWDLPKEGRDEPIQINTKAVGKRFYTPKLERIKWIKDYSWWKKTPGLHYLVEKTKWTHPFWDPNQINPSKVTVSYNWKRPGYVKKKSIKKKLEEQKPYLTELTFKKYKEWLIKKRNTRAKVLKAPKLDGNFVNKNFIEFRQQSKNHAIREAKFFKKFLKAKYERNKKYRNRVKMWHLPPKYSNLGKSIDTKASHILDEGYKKKFINTMSKLIFNKIDIYLWHFQITDRFWHTLEAIFGIDTKHTIFYALTKNKILTNYWCWWIKISLKLLSNNQEVINYWYKESEKHSINFSDKYLNYIRGKKISFNQTHLDNFNIIIIKFITKIFILIATFLSFLYNFLFFWLENVILTNISKVFELLSYFGF